MKITPTHITIGRIFEQNFLFEVPKYQRYYAWEDEQVNDFIKDFDTILKSSSDGNQLEHFFGGIVCAAKAVEGSTRQQKELIDGQQRMTTVILLIVNIISAYNELLNAPDLLHEDVDIITSRIKKLTEKYIVYQDEINRRPQAVHKLVLSFADKAFFENILNGTSVEPSRDSHHRLIKGHTLLRSYIDRKLLECATTSEKIDRLQSIENVLQTSCTVIFMDCDSRASAYKLFQVLNDRGAGLNEGDLLKSKTLEALENFPLQQDNAQRCWDEILQEDPSKVESFLRTYYASTCGKRAGRTSLYDDFLGAYFETLARGDADISPAVSASTLEVIKSMLVEIRLYRKISNGEWPFEEAQPITDWDRNRLSVLVKFLAYDITMPLLLAATKLGHKRYAELVHNLEKFMFRYKTICGNSHQVLSEIYMAEAKKIRTDPTNYSFMDLYARLKELINERANNETFSVQLKNLKYNVSGGNKQLRYLFSTLCDYYRWYAEGKQGKPLANKENCINYDNVTVEHIASQNPSSPQVLFQGNDVHKLYNLTILSQDDNGRRVSNKPFVEKKSVYQHSNYRINEKLCTYDEWNLSNAEDWQQFLVSFACDVFVL